MATSPRMKICVVHLSWAGADPAALASFLTSYGEHPAGMPHRLVIAWNGYRDRAELTAAQRLAAGVEHDDFVVATPKLDLAVYRDVAKWAGEPAMGFINSYSRLLADSWLAHMTRWLAQSDIGLVGATGSWESPLSSAPLPLRILRAGRYPPFPNPHIRTNGFMLERERFLALRWREVRRKRDAYELESGNYGITRQIEAQGLRAVIVGRDGRAYDRDRWPESGTFRVRAQENLLVEDNRTRDYATAKPGLARRLSRNAWGNGSGAPLRAPAEAG